MGEFANFLHQTTMEFAAMDMAKSMRTMARACETPEEKKRREEWEKEPLRVRLFGTLFR